ncbi:cation diffusion facilitator family transporter [uncultured Draconibacterium sp.]|uniref:cation diffusion facilitator family transporter n=1 Tax=uncultured Draconibacterium sp. TaxID=1573823 RepID=UPI0032600149
MQKHDHHHHHHDVKGKKLLWVTILNLAITFVQVVGGIVSNSLSLLSDALHNLGDSSAIFIAFLAGKRSHKEANEQKTFGYKRIEILAALFNGVVLIGICLYLFIEAYQRFLHPEPIKGKIMFIVASFGLLANLISVVVLNKDKNDNLNIRAAYLHLLGDTFSSVAVIIGGLAIWKFGVFWIDPLITVLVGLYIIYHTWDVVKETVDILMQSTPADIDLSKIKNEVEKIEEIDNIHHIHVWKLDDTQIHLEAHINLAKNITMKQLMEVRAQAEEVLHQKFGIAHITLQAGYKCCGTNPDLLAH